jgi:DNA-binding GntR family transcriptional regulator
MGHETADEAPRKDPRLSAQVYDLLRRRIILGELSQGVRLAEQRLAEELDVSRVPLREAIPQLETDGFVRSLPRRGAVVTEWTAGLIHDLFDTRLALETAAARHAAARVAAGASADVLLQAQAETEAEFEVGDELAMANASAQYHQALVDTAGNALLSGLMRATSGRMAWLFYLTRQRDPHVACAEHRKISDAVLSGNERLVEALVYAHIEAGREPSLAAMESVL